MLIGGVSSQNTPSIVKNSGRPMSKEYCWPVLIVKVVQAFAGEEDPVAVQQESIGEGAICKPSEHLACDSPEECFVHLSISQFWTLPDASNLLCYWCMS